MQEMLQPGDYCSQDYKYLPYDVICPQAVTISNAGENNAHADHCEIRLLSVDTPLCCRRCEIAKKIAQDKGIELKTTTHKQKHSGPCECGNEKLPNAMFCSDCREKKKKASNAKWNAIFKQRRDAKIRYCKCGEVKAKRTQYCQQCKIEVQRIRRMKSRATSQAIIKHCERRLEELTGKKEE